MDKFCFFSGRVSLVLPGRENDRMNWNLRVVLADHREVRGGRLLPLVVERLETLNKRDRGEVW